MRYHNIRSTRTPALCLTRTFFLKISWRLSRTCTCNSFLVSSSFPLLGPRLEDGSTNQLVVSKVGRCSLSLSLLFAFFDFFLWGCWKVTFIEPLVEPTHWFSKLLLQCYQAVAYQCEVPANVIRIQLEDIVETIALVRLLLSWRRKHMSDMFWARD